MLTDWGGVGTAAAEPTHWSDINQLGHGALDRNQSPPTMMCSWNGAEKAPRVGVHRPAQDGLCGPNFDQLTGVHHSNAVADSSDQGEIMADVQDSGVMSLL